jgi:hypothetical protein
MQLQQAHLAPEVSEGDEIFSQDPHPQWEVLEFVRKTHRLPIATEIFAARRAGPYVGQFVILLGHMAMQVGAKWRG